MQEDYENVSQSRQFEEDYIQVSPVSIRWISIYMYQYIDIYSIRSFGLDKPHDMSLIWPRRIRASHLKNDIGWRREILARLNICLITCDNSYI